MLTMRQLRDAKPAAWLEAAKGWRELAEQAAHASADLRSKVLSQVESAWKDAAGVDAAKTVNDLIGQYDIASDLCNGVVMILVGLSEAVELSQRELDGALQSAQLHRLLVSDDGVTTPLDAKDEDAAAWKTKLDPVLQDALRRATLEDFLAGQDLHKLGGEVGLTDPSKALEDQTQMSHDEIAMIVESLPRGQSAEEVSAWWNSLTDKEKSDLERAVPVELAALNGIPDTVKAELRGSGAVDRLALVQYAQTHWDDPTTDFKRAGADNCANYVSTSLAAAGMPKTGDWTDDDPVRGLRKWIPPPIPGHSPDAATHAWGGAQDLHDYLLDQNGNHAVARQDVRPGDIAFWYDNGNVHHAAVVTSVTPDGDVHYSQHSDPLANASLNGRARASDNQPVTFVRVDH